MGTSTKREKSRTSARATAKKASPKETKMDIASLEESIFDSPDNYNNIIQLLLATRAEIKKKPARPGPATLALCRVFVKLIGLGALGKPKDSTEAEVTIVKWLKDRFSQYLTAITEWFKEEPSTAIIAMLMAISQSEFEQNASSAWRNGVFGRLLELLLLSDNSSFHEARVFFVSEYLEKYRDLTYYFFRTIRLFYKNGTVPEALPTNGIDILLNWAPFDKKFNKKPCFVEQQNPTRQFSAESCLTEAQDIWLLFLGSGLSIAQRKAVLKPFTEKVSPWFQKPELLLDFLTDSFSIAGSTSLLALSGVYFLIVERNLEYPQFYQRLYALLDQNVLHSKHRSDFFRLLDRFMASTHLPSTLAASFMKRMSRLALHAPPAAIVIVIPWIYNMLKRHPSTTFMIHRVIRDPMEQKRIEEHGMEDPFLEDELDPLNTKAIDSCLWELVTLQSHYHPNVATVAKLIAQEFLKESYQLEDFLDYSYSSIIRADLVKKMRQVPAIEYEIPKHILMGDDDTPNSLGATFLSVASCLQ